jgi:hypothetical protein
LTGSACDLGADVSDDAEQFPKLPPRESDGESAERSEKRDQDRGWIADLIIGAVELAAGLISAWH